jgi:endonuclease/exonuclease/phosphatase (EEP) superfamily protein YafD
VTVPRAPLLDQVLARIRERRPDLVVGDFNAPRRSRALARLPAGWHHGYEVAGRGWSATWPQPVPLLAIDQLLVGPDWGVVDYRLLPGPGTDHRLQVAKLGAVRVPSPPTPR